MGIGQFTSDFSSDVIDPLLSMQSPQQPAPYSSNLSNFSPRQFMFDADGTEGDEASTDLYFEPPASSRGQR